MGAMVHNILSELKAAVEHLGIILLDQEELEYQKANIIGLDTDNSKEAVLQQSFENQQEVVMTIYRSMLSDDEALSALTQQAEPELRSCVVSGTATISDLWELLGSITEPDLDQIDQQMIASEQLDDLEAGELRLPFPGPLIS